MNAGKRGYVALAVITVAIVLTALATSGSVLLNVHASSLRGALASTASSAGTGTKATTIQTASAKVEVTKTVTETITVTATKTFYSIITFTQTTAQPIEYYGPMTFILLFIIMALTVALGFSLRRCRKLASST